MKVDVPESATGSTPWRITSVSRFPYYYSIIGCDAHGRKQFTGYRREIDVETLEPDSDIYAFAVDRVVSVSPISITMRANVDPTQLRQLLLDEETV